MQLLILCGPRLDSLQLMGGVQHWPSVTFTALRHCTALTALELEAGFKEQTDDEEDDMSLGTWLGAPRLTAFPRLVLRSSRRYGYHDHRRVIPVYR